MAINKEKKASLILDKWIADLKEKDRSRAAVEGNFEELIEALFKAQIEFESALETVNKAITAHKPSNVVIDATYRRLKSFVSKTKDEFGKEWRDNIEAAGKRVFYSIYTIDGTETSEPKNFGSMSASEYRKQRKYAESHALIDWTKIEIKPMSLDDFNIDDLNFGVDDE
jgi:hypothetical protein